MNSYLPSKSNREDVQTIVTRRHEIKGAVIAWTDGACEPNPGIGGWAYSLEQDGETVAEDYGGETQTTNNRMELLAIINAVCFKTAAPMIVRSDSQLCVLCAVGRWKRKTNLDLWSELQSACAGRVVVFEWWRGHCGTPGNERADELAAIGRATALPLDFSFRDAIANDRS